MANVRDSDTSLWLHNKLGTSNDSWISGSICSQLNKEVLRNIKECFSDLQTQVKLKLLLSFFHIPRRLVEEWKAELDEVIEVAGLDSELWVSMLAETMKTFPATSSLNTEISDYEDTRPIFTDMVNDLRKLVSKHSDLGMLPLECQYLNKNALVSVVGQQSNPVKHFTLKRKPKSANLRMELLHKSADAQSSLKKNSAPTIPLRSRGMPRKMTDTTPLKGIPSRVPTGGFRSPNVVTNQQRPNVSRTPAGRKDGGIKLIEFTEQPLGYAAAKKRKREQQLEEQQKKHEQKQNAAAVAASSTSPTTESASSQNTSGAGTAAAGMPTTPTSGTISFENKTDITTVDLNLSGSVDEVNMNSTSKETPLTPKAEPATPDYAPSLSYIQPSAVSGVETALDNIKSNSNLPVTKTAGLTTTTTLPGSKVSSVSVQTQSNDNLNHVNKRIKQEIEIKSEEILVPASIKLEKIETPPIQLLPTTKAILQPQPQQRLQQRLIIQQQPQTQQQPQAQHVLTRAAPQQQKSPLGSGITLTSNVARQQQTVNNAGTTIKMEKLEIKTLARATSSATSNAPTMMSQQQIRQTANPLANLPNNISVKITSTKVAKATQVQQQQMQQQQPIRINSSTPVILSAASTHTIRQKQPISSSVQTTIKQNIKSMPLSQLKTAANNGPVIISQTIIQPAKRGSNATVSGATITQAGQQQQQIPQQQSAGPQTTTQYILTSSASQQQQTQQQSMPALATFNSPTRPAQQTAMFQAGASGSVQAPTKILVKTSPTSGVVVSPVRQQAAGVTNPPPLIATSSAAQPTLLSIQNVQLPNRPVTIQPASQAAQQQHLQAQLQQQQPQQHTIVSNTSATQQPKLTQVVMQPAVAGPCGANTGVKNKTIILTQKGLILRNIGGDMYQQIPISNVSNLQGLGPTTLMTTTSAGLPGLVKTSSSHIQSQTLQLQHTQQPNKPQQLPTLIPTNALTQQHMLVQQPQTQSTQQTIIRPMLTNVHGSLGSLPQGLTLIQRPGQQPQLVQVQTAPQQRTQLQRAIITQPAQQPLRQQIVLQQKPTPQRVIGTATATSSGTQQLQIQQSNANLTRGTRIVQVTQQQQLQQQQVPQRKGLSLSNEHVHKAHEMFRKANRVSRPDKALILGFMAGLRENPRPNSENVIVIKLGDSEEKVQQEDGNTVLCLMESLIRLDYNTGEWKTFQNYRRLDQSTSSGQAGEGVMQTQNSVII